MAYLAAIDIGSNALRLAIARQNKEELHICYQAREPLRLGQVVFSQGSIDSTRLQSLEKALLKFKNQMENYNVSKYRAVATSAMREASNHPEVVAHLDQTHQLKVEVISAEEEARLVSLAVSKRIDLHSKNHLLIDIGGGSIELVALEKGQILKKQSFPLGGVRVLQLHGQKKQALQDWLPQLMEEELKAFFESLPPLERGVGTGGSMDRFIKLKEFISREGGRGLSLAQMEQLESMLSSVSYSERIEKYALKPDRADVIIPAAIATIELMKMARAQEILFPQVGLKEGLLYELSSSKN